MCVWLTMAKLPPVIRPPAMGLEEAKAVAVKARQEPRIYDMIEIFGASKSLFRGFEMGGYIPVPSFDVRSLAFLTSVNMIIWKGKLRMKRSDRRDTQRDQ